MIYLGIDPGRSGGLAALFPDGLVSFKTMPTTERGIWDWLWLLRDHAAIPSILGGTYTESIQAVIERISPAVFGTAKTSMSKLYGSYMALRMALVACDIPFTAVPSATIWRALGIPPRKKQEGKSVWKQRLKAKAQVLFPKLKITLATSDALLIAAYCRQINSGSIGKEKR